ncbi:hypothetical protein M514_11393, partial [Trichuris suis]
MLTSTWEKDGVISKALCATVEQCKLVRQYGRISYAYQDDSRFACCHPCDRFFRCLAAGIRSVLCSRCLSLVAFFFAVFRASTKGGYCCGSSLCRGSHIAVLYTTQVIDPTSMHFTISYSFGSQGFSFGKVNFATAQGNNVDVGSHSHRKTHWKRELGILERKLSAHAGTSRFSWCRRWNGGLPCLQRGGSCHCWSYGRAGQIQEVQYVSAHTVRCVQFDAYDKWKRTWRKLHPGNKPAELKCLPKETFKNGWRSIMHAGLNQGGLSIGNRHKALSRWKCATEELTRKSLTGSAACAGNLHKPVFANCQR